MVTEMGFVSLLVAGFGALAGGLAYLAIRIGRPAPRRVATGRAVGGPGAGAVEGVTPPKGWIR
jgi:hypothetical protein